MEKKMTKSSTLLIGLAVALVFSLVPHTAFAATPLPERATTAEPTFAFRLFGGANDADAISAETIARYRFFMISPYMTEVAQKIKTVKPDAVVYMYKDSSSTRRNLGGNQADWCNPGGDTIGRDWGVDYCDTDANHPEWFMTYNTGSRFEYNSYASHWHTDVGATGYKEAWTANVLEDLESNPTLWDGVLIDNILVDIRNYVPGQVFPDQYADVDSGQAAYVTFMDYVGTQMQAAGYGMMGNQAGARFDPGIWDDFSAQASGGYDEYWTTNGDAAQNIGIASVGWQHQIAQAQDFTPQDKMLVASAQTSNGACEECARYAYASYLLTNDGLHAFIENNFNLSDGDWVPARPMYSWDLGLATSALEEIQGAGNGLVQRTYEDGLVIVNAHYTEDRTVELSEAYLDENGDEVTSVEVNALRGRILRAVPGVISPPEEPEDGSSSDSDYVTFFNGRTNRNNALQATGGCDALSEVELDAEVQPSLPVGQTNLSGALSFEAGCDSPGQSSTITYLLDKVYDTSGMRLHKFNSSLDSRRDITSVATFGTSSLDGEQVTSVTYTLTDGGELDQDGSTNGTIVDPIVVSMIAEDGELANTGTSFYFVAAAGGAMLLLGAGSLLGYDRRHGTFQRLR